MSNVIAFPGNKKDTLEQAISYFENAYKEAGLSPIQILSAIEELEPLIREFLPRKEFIFNLSGELNLTEMQASSISQEHNRCMQEAISYFGEQLWLSLCATAGIIGRNILEST